MSEEQAQNHLIADAGPTLGEWLSPSSNPQNTQPSTEQDNNSSSAEVSKPNILKSDLSTESSTPQNAQPSTGQDSNYSSIKISKPNMLKSDLSTEPIAVPTSSSLLSPEVPLLPIASPTTAKQANSSTIPVSPLPRDPLKRFANSSSSLRGQTLKKEANAMIRGKSLRDNTPTNDSSLSVNFPPTLRTSKLKSVSSTSKVPQLKSRRARETFLTGPTGTGTPTANALSTPPNLTSSSSRNRKFLYSTDDDEHEIEADFEREYFSGYSDGLKNRLRRLRSKMDSTFANTEEQFRTSNTGSDPVIPRKASQLHSSLKSPQVESIDNVHNWSKTQSISSLHDVYNDNPISVRSSDFFSDPIDPKDRPEEININMHHLHEEIDHDEQLEDLGGDDDSDSDDNASIASVESFTLRERQDAINTTHPFGIRIWKPAVYKKIRSVQRIAEGDIHSAPGKIVTWDVWAGNILWTLTFGFILFIFCSIAALSCIILCFSSSCVEYGKAFWALGKYLLLPFGKFVELKQDENYLDEDEGLGRSISEYERWQTGDLERGKLFFGPTSTNQLSSRRLSQSKRRMSNLQASGEEDTQSRENRDISDNSSNKRAVTNLDSDIRALRGRHRPSAESASETDSLLGSHDDADDNNASVFSDEYEPSRKRRYFGRGQWNLGRIIYYLWFYIVITPVLYFISGICWFLVFLIPMGKVTTILASHLRRHPLALSYKNDSFYYRLNADQINSSVLLSTYRAAGWKYYKYTIDGTNIFFINLMALVAFVIADYYILYEGLNYQSIITDPSIIFMMSMIAIIPLAYFIGQGVASISAQSSMGMGAFINALFSTMVEVFLYCVALSQGKGDLVEGSVIGSILAGVLLLPGLSMCAGAIKRKTQRYNPKSAGVSSTMLLFAVLGAFAPTIFYNIYGSYELQCSGCDDGIATNFARGASCQRCHMFQLPLMFDQLYNNAVKPFSYICAILLFISYVIGLWFTLRTHAALIWQTPTTRELIQAPNMIAEAGNNPDTTEFVGESSTLDNRTTQLTNLKRLATSAVALPSEEDVRFQLPMRANTVDGYLLSPVNVAHTLEEVSTTGNKDTEYKDGGGHDAPNWSRTKSSIILLGATVLYAVIAEILVGTVDIALANFPIKPKIIGLTLFALVPNVTEFLNAISFAINGNIALSMEIGSAYVLQVCLLQIPALVLYSIWRHPDESTLTLKTQQFFTSTSTVVQANAKLYARKLSDELFTLVFPRWDLIIVIFCVFLFNYIYSEGKSNYFKGSILVLSYTVVMSGFFFASFIEDLGYAGSSGQLFP